MDIIPIFPTLVWESDIQSPKRLIDYCLTLSENSVGRSVSNAGGGWQSEDNLHLDESFYQRYLINLFNNLSFLPDFEVNNCWINVNYQGSYNQSHRHPGHDLALVWYVQTPKDCGNIVFENPNILGRTKILDYTDQNIINSFNSNECFPLPALKDKCYIFPGDLRHFVQTNNSKYPRISISANLSILD